MTDDLELTEQQRLQKFYSFVEVGIFYTIEDDPIYFREWCRSSVFKHKTYYSDELINS
jgi:hypothetical protein